MKFPSKVEKTIVFIFQNQKIMVSELPEELRNEFETLDRIKQDRMDAYYALEVLELAFQQKTMQLNTKLVEHYNKINEADTNDQIIESKTKPENNEDDKSK